MGYLHLTILYKRKREMECGEQTTLYLPSVVSSFHIHEA